MQAAAKEIIIRISTNETVSCRLCDFTPYGGSSVAFEDVCNHLMRSMAFTVSTGIWLPPSTSCSWPLHRTGHRPRVINVDGHPAYATAITELIQAGELGRRCRCRPSPYMNNVLEQDHRFIKKRIAASLWFRWAARSIRSPDMSRCT